MPSTQLVDLQGNRIGDIALDEAVFGIEPKTHVMHSALIRQLANARAGTAATKTRSEVSGGGRKPWRQKGTGRARAGSTRSPLWAGGGVIFGPKPRDYRLAMPKKVRRLALKSALAARKDNLVVVQSFEELAQQASESGPSIKTREMAAVLKRLGIDRQKVLLVVDRSERRWEEVKRAARNIAAVRVLEVNDLNVKDLVECDVLLTSQHALTTITGRFKPAVSSAATGEKEPNGTKTRKRTAQAELEKGEGTGQPPRSAAGKKGESSSAEAPPARKSSGKKSENSEETS